jgi:hypothetical protein
MGYWEIEYISKHIYERYPMHSCQKWHSLIHVKLYVGTSIVLIRKVFIGVTLLMSVYVVVLVS